MLAGQWMGHMWNEVFVGRWVTVDTGYNEIGESQLLLKFIHSDTVGGTQSRPDTSEVTVPPGVIGYRACTRSPLRSPDPNRSPESRRCSAWCLADLPGIASEKISVGGSDGE